MFNPYNQKMTCLSVLLFVHRFGPIGINLGMDTPWDHGSDMGWVRLRFANLALHYMLLLKRFFGFFFFHFYEKFQDG